MNSRVRPAARLRWTFISLWEPIRDYLIYPTVQWILISLVMIYVLLVFRVFNRMTIIGKENLSLEDSGDLFLGWHESMGCSFAFGAALGPSLIIHQRRIPWNFAAAENFMTRRWARVAVTMLKAVPVRRSEQGKRADSTALRQAIKLLQTTNVLLFPSGGRYVYGQPEVFNVSPGIGLTVTKARRVTLFAFTGMAGKDPILPYYKSWQDVPVRPWHRLLGRYSDVPRYLTWTVGFKSGRRLVFKFDEPIEVADLLNEFPLDMPNREQKIADSMMQRIIELRRQILPSEVV